jgi:hypothetical protein
MTIRGRSGPPSVVVPRIGADALYEVDLTVAPSPVWRAAFRRPPPAMVTPSRTPDVGRLSIRGASVQFRGETRHLGGWLRGIDKWIAYANSVVESPRSLTRLGKPG